MIQARRYLTCAGRPTWDVVALCLAQATALLFFLGKPPMLSADDAARFFADGAVHEIRIGFADEGWYDTLYDSHANDPEDPYFPASFEADGVVIPRIGVRFKGNSSFEHSNVKKSFKLDFDAYDSEAHFFGWSSST